MRKRFDMVFIQIPSNGVDQHQGPDSEGGAVGCGGDVDGKINDICEINYVV